MKKFLKTYRTKPESVKRFLSSAVSSKLHSEEHQVIGCPVSRVNLPGFKTNASCHSLEMGLSSSMKSRTVKSSLTRASNGNKSRETRALVSSVVDEVLNFKPTEASKIALNKIFHTISKHDINKLNCREADTQGECVVKPFPLNILDLKDNNPEAPDTWGTLVNSIATVTIEAITLLIK